MEFFFLSTFWKKKRQANKEEVEILEPLSHFRSHQPSLSRIRTCTKGLHRSIAINLWAARVSQPENTIQLLHQSRTDQFFFYFSFLSFFHWPSVVLFAFISIVFNNMQYLITLDDRSRVASVFSTIKN